MERRNNLRQCVNEPVQVRLEDSPSASVSGRINNISNDGFGLVLSGYFPVGTHLHVECKECRLSGIVVYSLTLRKKSGDIEYLCGIQMDHVAWSSTGNVS